MKTPKDLAFEEYCDEYKLDPAKVPASEKRAFDDGWSHCWLLMSRAGGSAKSKEKANAARENGKLGGRPKLKKPKSSKHS